jgi:hypothetical protein
MCQHQKNDDLIAKSPEQPNDEKLTGQLLSANAAFPNIGPDIDTKGDQ